MATFISRITLSLRYAVYGNDLTEVTRPLAHGAANTGESNSDDAYPLDRMSAKKRPNPSPYSPAVDIDTHYLEGVDYADSYGYGRSGSYSGYSGDRPRSPTGGEVRIQTQTLQSQTQAVNGISVEQSVVILRD
jgi:hypothetical protein